MLICFLANSDTMSINSLAGQILAIKDSYQLLSGSGDASYILDDPTTPTTPSNPSGDGASGGVGAGGDDDEWAGQGAKKYNNWNVWNDYNRQRWLAGNIALPM